MSYGYAMKNLGLMKYNLMVGNFNKHARNWENSPCDCYKLSLISIKRYTSL